jgi:hypothetical protein
LTDANGNAIANGSTITFTQDYYVKAVNDSGTSGRTVGIVASYSDASGHTYTSSASGEDSAKVDIGYVRTGGTGTLTVEFWDAHVEIE